MLADACDRNDNDLDHDDDEDQQVLHYCFAERSKQIIKIMGLQKCLSF